MRKSFTALILGITIIMVILLAGCSKEVTLNLTYGSKTGTYSGDMVDGVPNGHGKFVSKNSEGVKWTYEGEFKNGHFEGEGKTTWETGQIEIGTYKDDVIVPITGDELNTLYTNPEDLKNHCVEFIGQVFTTPEYGDGYIAIQVYADYENFDKTSIVYISDTDFDVKQDDFVKIKGMVGDVFKGTNIFGAELSVPTISAIEYEKISYTDATSPTLKEITVEEKQEQLGYGITVQKVEFSEKETRVYIKVDNNGSDKFSLYSFNTILSQNGKQYEEQDNWDADYPEIQTDLMVGNTTEGIIAFPPIEQSDFSIIFEAYSDNYHETIEPYTFNINC